MVREHFKIVYLINGLGSGGAEMMLYRLLQRLDRSRFEPEVITLLEIEGPLAAKIKSLGVQVNSIDTKSKTDIGSIIRLYKVLKKKEPVIVHGQLYAADLLSRLVGSLAGVPIIISSIRNERYGNYFRDYLIKITERFTTRTTIVSKSAAERFINDRVIPRYKLKIIYNGINPNDFYFGLNENDKNALRISMNLPKEKFLILSVASLTNQKGYYDLIKATQRLIEEDNDLLLLLAGSGPLEKELKRWVNELNLKQNVCFIGRSDNVPKLMALADCFVLSSHWEGLPGVILEAMASELPVVATAVGGTPELVSDGVTGYLVPPKMPGQLATALKNVIEMDVSERIFMGQAGRKRVEEHFHVDEMVKAYEQLYYECLQEKIFCKDC